MTNNNKKKDSLLKSKNSTTNSFKKPLLIHNPYFIYSTCCPIQAYEYPIYPL